MTVLFKKIVITALSRQISKRGWKPKKNALGVEGIRLPNKTVEHTVTFTVTGNREEGIYFQPGIGVRFFAVNDIKNQLTPTNFSRNPYTEYFPIVLLLPREQATNILRWFIPVSAAEETDELVRCLAKDVFEVIAESKFFEQMLTIDDYTTAVEQKKWPFYETGQHHYLAALLEQRKLAEAKFRARELKELYVKQMKVAGLSPEEKELEFFKRVHAWS